jgi:hypothetical protein
VNRAKTTLLCLPFAFLATTTSLGQVLVPLDYPTIEEAIERSPSGSVIDIAAGTYFPAVTLDPNSKDLVLRGATDSSGNALTRISGQGVRQVFRITNGETAACRFENLIITDGFDGNGAGMYIKDSSPTLSNLTFRDNYSPGTGGALLVWGAASAPRVQSCFFLLNEAAGAGGAVQNAFGSVDFSSCVFQFNSAGAGGGGMRNYSCTTSLHNCTFQGNTGSVGGGLVSIGGTATINGCSFVKNESRLGGGVANDHTDASYTNCRFENNRAVDSGGASRGGGIYDVGDTTTYQLCSFYANEADGEGGAMYFSSTTSSLTNCFLTNNRAGLRGGGLFAKGSEITAQAIAISSNDAAEDGGGLYLGQYGVAHLFDAIIEGNTALNDGGGIFVSQFGETDLIHSVVCRNVHDQIFGAWTDNGSNCVTAICLSCGCPADVNGDALVNGADLALVMAAWGTTGPTGDINSDGIVDSSDIALVLAAWGPC